MSITPSTAAHLPLPGWAYVPGEAADSQPDHETLARAKALVPAQFFGFVPTRHPALRYGMALNDAGYFWESQQVLEAVWAAAPQGGRERILLRACIQIANANLKMRMQKLTAAERLWGEALTALNQLLRRSHAAGDGFVDRFPTAQLATRLMARLARPGLARPGWVTLGLPAQA